MIDDKIIEELSGLKSNEAFNCNLFGLVNSTQPNTLSFIDDKRYLEQLNSNPCITVVITTFAFENKIFNKLLIFCDDPRFYFYDIVNKIGERNYVSFPSIISPTAKIHPRAFVAENNVIIGDRTFISANATILSDVEIGQDCFIQSGAVIGSEGYEYKRTSRGIISVYHDGKVIVGNNVAIGANATIVKGFSFRQTIIEDEVKIDNLVYIAHGVQIKQGTFIIGCAMISGSVDVGKNVWIGPAAVTSNGIKIGQDAYITMGSVVSKNVRDAEKVSGNFAIEHKMFLRHIKQISSINNFE